jgi:hypothetical protein
LHRELNTCAQCIATVPWLLRAQCERRDSSVVSASPVRSGSSVASANPVRSDSPLPNSCELPKCVTLPLLRFGHLPRSTQTETIDRWTVLIAGELGGVHTDARCKAILVRITRGCVHFFPETVRYTFVPEDPLVGFVSIVGTGSRSLPTTLYPSHSCSLHLPSCPSHPFHPSGLPTYTSFSLLGRPLATVEVRSCAAVRVTR